MPLNLRVQVWLEMVPALLEKLGVDCISILGHSAGVIFPLNSAIYHRGLLDPERPYIALVGSCSLRLMRSPSVELT